MLILNNKIVSTKRTSAIFLAIVLVTGTFALSNTSSFIIKGVEVQAQQYYDGMDNNNNNDYENEYVPSQMDYANSYDDEERDNGQYGKPYYNEKPYSDDGKSYDNDNMYSKYPPTKDKKYVCQTGQFEGFFVESLEFCNLNIPAGPQGPEGPPGQINFTNTYFVVGTGASTGETPSRAFSVASCDPGDIVLEGGGGVASFFDEGLGNVFLLIREPINEGNGYRVGGVAANTGFDSNAICIDNPPLR